MKFIYLALLVVFFVCNTHAASFYGDVEQPVDADVAKELFQQFNKDNAVEHGTRAEDHHLLRWGYLGHETTARIAFSLVNDNTKAHLMNLLPKEKGDISKVASWADTVRKSEKYAWSGNMHFIDTDDFQCYYDPVYNCTEEAGYCVDSAIQNYTGRLLNQTLSRADRVEALKFLVHFVGDIHQPLHVSFLNDEGGNKVTGSFFNKKGNLHGIWDYTMIAHHVDQSFDGKEFRWQEYLEEQIGEGGVYSAQASEWVRCQETEHQVGEVPACSYEWAQESAKLACEYAYVAADGKTHLKTGFHLGEDYFQRAIPVINQQVAKAGVRTAAVLDAIFETYSPPSSSPSSPVQPEEQVKEEIVITSWN